MNTFYNHLYFLFKILNFSVIIFIGVLILYVSQSYKVTGGDNVFAPYYKKTLYNNVIFASFDFKPFFAQIKKNMEEDKNITHYKGLFHYNEKAKYFSKVELICFYKIGKKLIGTLEANKIFYIDKTRTLHLSFDLINRRHEENFVAAYIYKAENIYGKKDKKIIKEFRNADNLLIGYTILTGDIQYQIILDEDE